MEIDKNEIPLPKFFTFGEIEDTPDIIKVSISSPTNLEDLEFTYTDLRDKIIGSLLNDISISIIKKAISKIEDSASKQYVDLRRLGLYKKVDSIVSSILSSGGNFCLSGTRISSEIQDSSRFVIYPSDRTTMNLSVFHIGFLNGDSMVSCYADPIQKFSSNIVYTFDGVQLDIRNLSIDDSGWDVGTFSPKITATIEFLVQVSNPKSIRFFDDNCLDGIGEWVNNQRIEKISDIENHKN